MAANMAFSSGPWTANDDNPIIIQIYKFVSSAPGGIFRDGGASWDCAFGLTRLPATLEKFLTALSFRARIRRSASRRRSRPSPSEEGVALDWNPANPVPSGNSHHGRIGPKAQQSSGRPNGWPFGPENVELFWNLWNPGLRPRWINGWAFGPNVDRCAARNMKWHPTRILVGYLKLIALSANRPPPPIIPSSSGSRRRRGGASKIPCDGNADAE